MGLPSSVNTVSDPLSEAGKVAFDGDTDCAEASVEYPKRAMVKKLAMLLATVDAAMITRKERM